VSVYTGGLPTVGTSISTRKYTDAGVAVWGKNHGATVYAIAVDSAGNVYTGGARTGNLTTRKYDPNGTLLWSVDHGADVRGIAVDASGNVYAGGVLIPGVGSLRKYNAAGALQWTVNTLADVYCVAASSSGNVYTGGDMNEGTTHMFDTTGEEQWMADHEAVVAGIAVDGDGNVYTGGARTAGNLTTRKYSPAGNLLWSIDHGDAVFAVAAGSDGAVVTCGIDVSGVTTRKYTANGVQIWGADDGDVATSVAIGVSGSVYTIAGMTGTTRKRDPAGTSVWNVDHGMPATAIAVLEDVVVSEYDDVVAGPIVGAGIFWSDAVGWVDESEYLLMDNGMDVQRSMIDPLRGLASMGQAPLGTATGRFRNDDGRYSKTVAGSMAATYGLHGNPIQVTLSYQGGTPEVIFTGRIVEPQNTEAGEVATLYCRDEGETLLKQTASRIMNSGAQTGDLVATYLTEGGWTAVNGTDMQVDKGLFLVPFAYLEEDNLWSELQRLAASEAGLVFIDRLGLLRFWDSSHFDKLSSVATYDESLYGEALLRYDYQNKYNVIAVNYEPRQESQAATVFTLRRAVEVPIGGTATETFQFRWPLAAFDGYTLAAVTGGGADLSDDVSISPSVPQHAQSWTVEFTNANTVHAAYITTFEVAGRVAQGRPSEVYEADPDGVAGTKAARKLSLGGNFYIQTPGQARLIGNLLSDRLAEEVLTIQLVQCPALPTLELGDKLTVLASNHEIYGDFIITGLHYTFGPAAKCDITLVDAANLYGTSGYFVVGTSELGAGKLFY